MFLHYNLTQTTIQKFEICNIFCCLL